MEDSVGLGTWGQNPVTTGRLVDSLGTDLTTASEPSDNITKDASEQVDALAISWLGLGSPGRSKWGFVSKFASDPTAASTTVDMLASFDCSEMGDDNCAHIWDASSSPGYWKRGFVDAVAPDLTALSRASDVIGATDWKDALFLLGVGNSSVEYTSKPQLAGQSAPKPTSNTVVDHSSSYDFVDSECSQLMRAFSTAGGKICEMRSWYPEELVKRQLRSYTMGNKLTLSKFVHVRSGEHEGQSAVVPVVNSMHRQCKVRFSQSCRVAMLAWHNVKVAGSDSASLNEKQSRQQ